MNYDTLKQTCQQYIAADYTIILIHKNEKRPVGNDWQNRPGLSIGELGRAVKEHGYNLGVRLGPQDIIIDVDVKAEKPGKISLDRLIKDYPELGKLSYSTRTPSGGLHYLAKLPDGVAGSDLKMLHKRYPGIDFLTKGQQALIGGSTVDGRQYQPNPELKFPVGVIPLAFAEELARRPSVASASSSAESHGWGILTHEELATILADVDVMLYGKIGLVERSWDALMMGCHFATAGLAEEEFIAWSLRDPEYTDEEANMRRRWRSLDSDMRTQPRTAWQLHKELKELNLTKHMKPLREKLDRVKLAFPSEPARGFDPDELVHTWKRKLEQNGIDSAAIYQLMRDFILQNDPTQFEKQEIVNFVHAVVWPASTPEKVPGKQHLMYYLKHVELEKEKNERASDPERQFTRDSEDRQLVHDFVMAMGGQDALIYSESKFWVWSQKRGHYVPMGSDQLGGLIDKFLTKQSEDISGFRLNAMIDMLRKVQSRDAHFWVVPELDNGGVINVPNGELWLTEQGWELRPHNMANRRRAVSGVDYLPELQAEPTRWLQFIEESFDEDVADLAGQKIAVMMIYTLMDSLPFYKKGMMIQGPPNTGKSKLIELIDAMVGPGNASSLSIADLHHGKLLPGLVGKLANTQGEVNVKVQEANRLKAIIAGDTVQADPKNLEPFNFKNRAVFWFAANQVPRFLEGETGIQDRFVVLPMIAAKAARDRDVWLLDKLKAEITDIFLWALNIYHELAEQGRRGEVLDEPLYEEAAFDEDSADDSLGNFGTMEPHVHWIRTCMKPLAPNQPNTFFTLPEIHDNYLAYQQANPQLPLPIVENTVSMGRYMAKWRRTVEGVRIQRRTVNNMRGWGGFALVSPDSQIDDDLENYLT